MNISTFDDALPDVRFGFVLTKEGRAVAEETLLHLTDIANRNWPPPANAPAGSGILWEAGTQINDPGVLGRILRKYPNCIIAISMPERFSLINNANDPKHAMADYLEAAAEIDDEVTSWEIFVDQWEEAEKAGGQ